MNFFFKADKDLLHSLGHDVGRGRVSIHSALIHCLCFSLSATFFCLLLSVMISY
jgi:hypothetical protein